MTLDLDSERLLAASAAARSLATEVAAAQDVVVELRRLLRRFSTWNGPRARITRLCTVTPRVAARFV